MGSVVVGIRICGPKGEAIVRALVDIGFFGDVITLPRYVEGTGIEFKYERLRRLPDGRIVRARFGGGEIILEDSVTYGDIEAWNELKLPEGVEALLGVTALEKLGYRVNPRTGRLEKVELYLLTHL